MGGEPNPGKDDWLTIGIYIAMFAAIVLAAVILSWVWKMLF